jgi:hypothetical protein
MFIKAIPTLAKAAAPAAATIPLGGISASRAGGCQEDQDNRGRRAEIRPTNRQCHARARRDRSLMGFADRQGREASG